MEKTLTLKILLLAILAQGLVGCASKIPQWEAANQNKAVFSIATQQLPPEPVYNPVRWVRPPQVLPTREAKVNRAPLIHPIIHFEVEKTPLEETARILAAVGRYRSYCSSLVAKRLVTLNTLGNMDELAQQISKITKTRVIIDHQNKEVRVVADTYIAPEF